MSTFWYYWEKIWALVEEALFGDYYVPVDHIVMPINNTPKPISSSQQNGIDPDVLNPDWTDPKHAYHNVRVLCDLSGLSVVDKNIICACIYQESQFLNIAKHQNIVHGKVSSTDWGICQINDYWQVGSGRPFSSVQDIIDNPQKAVQFMINMFGQGELHLWVSYSSGAYKQWLLADSPMWALGK